MSDGYLWKQVCVWKQQGLFHQIVIHTPRKSVNRVPGGCSQAIKSQGVKRLKQLSPGGINSRFNCV